MSRTITITRPDDWHLHLRDGAAMASVAGHTAQRFRRAIIMPNLKPPVTTTELALAYRQRILDALPADTNFEPLMTLYLADNTSPDEIIRAKASGKVAAVKYYPAGATTNSDAGVTRIERTYPALEAMAEVGMPLLMHGEVVHADVDVFDREAVFIEEVLGPLMDRFDTLKIVFEHITTRQAVEFVQSAPERVGATMTPQHLMLNRNALLVGGIRPHHYCLPVLKREQHREALLEAAVSGNPRFFLGTDSAPHARELKESPCGCAGIYSAHAAIELYAEIFDDAGALDKLEGFASFHGADFYGLPRNGDKLTLVREPQDIPDNYSFGESTVVPMRAGEQVGWRLRQQ